MAISVLRKTQQQFKLSWLSANIQHQQHPPLKPMLLLLLSRVLPLMQSLLKSSLLVMKT